MLCRHKMFGGVTIDRVVTAADMATGFAQPQMKPPVAGFQAVFAADGTRRYVPDR
jgi:hypothetical protein